jgi:hypothetical protein
MIASARALGLWRGNAGEVHTIGRKDDPGFHRVETILAAPRARHVQSPGEREGGDVRDCSPVFVRVHHRRTADLGDQGTAASAERDDDAEREPRKRAHR